MRDKDSLNQHLDILGISDIEVEALTVHNVKVAFSKLALIRHPDKAGGSTAAFQQLLHSYNTVLKHLAENLREEGLDKDEQFLKDLFMNFNFPKENDMSFTIYIENKLADHWDYTLANMYNDPIIHPTNYGRQWKTGYSFEESSAKISLTLWKNPKTNKQSKILIQGGKQSLNTIFVFNVLPKLYQEVKQMSTASPYAVIEGLSSTNKAECTEGSNSSTAAVLTDSTVTPSVSRPSISLYHCSQCKVTFSNNDTYNEHSQTYHAINCKQCDKSFESNEHLKNHHESEHYILPSTDQSSDKFCDKPLESNEQFQSHSVSDHVVLLSIEQSSDTSSENNEAEVNNSNEQHAKDRDTENPFVNCSSCKFPILNNMLQCELCSSSYHKTCTNR